MKVLKVGGSCLVGPSDYGHLAGRVSAEGAGVVVVSALQGVTDALLACVARAAAGAPCDLDPLVERHRGLLEGAGQRREAARTRLERLLEELAARVARLRGSGPDPWEADAVLGLGERLSLVAAWAHAGGEMLVAAEAGIETSAAPGAARILDAGAGAARARLGGGGLSLVAGYVGQTPAGRWTTLGRGGSDVTAVWLAWALGGEAVLLKDSPGVQSADPRRVPGTRTLVSLSATHALALAAGGSPVVAGGALELCQERGLSLRVQPWDGPGPGTRISARDATDGLALALGADTGAPWARVTCVGRADEGLADAFRQALESRGIQGRVAPAGPGVLVAEVPLRQGLEALRAFHTRGIG